MVLYSSGAESISEDVETIIAAISTINDSVGQINTTITPQPLATVFNTAVTASTDILSEDLSITSTGIIRITVAVSSDTTFSIVITRNGTSVTLDYNSGNDLVGNAVYMFDVGVRDGDEINFQAGANVTLLLLNVDFVGA